MLTVCVLSEQVASVTVGARVADAVQASGEAVPFTKTVTIPVLVPAGPRNAAKRKFFKVPAEGAGRPIGPVELHDGSILPSGKSQFTFPGTLETTRHEADRIAGVLGVSA